MAFIPGTKHGTREVFEDKVLLKGCEVTGAMEAMMASGMSEDDAEDELDWMLPDETSVSVVAVFPREGGEEDALGVLPSDTPMTVSPSSKRWDRKVKTIM